MKKKKIFWYLVFTSILGAKYCDKVPLSLASSGPPGEVRPDCILQKGNTIVKKKSANPFIFLSFLIHALFCLFVCLFCF